MPLTQFRQRFLVVCKNLVWPNEYMKSRNETRSWRKSNEHVAVMLMTRPVRTDAGRKVRDAVLARIEISMAIEDALRG